MEMLITVLLCVSIINFSPVFSDDFVPCDNGWYYFRDKCYRVGARKGSERLTWSRALNRCKSYGADLASIHSQEEQDFIVGFLLLDVKSSAWTGLNDRDKEGEFKWNDGSIYNYTNWNTHEPSQYGDEDCMHLLFFPHKGEVGQWNDMPCEDSQAYICEKNTNPRKRSPNMMYCSSEEGGGWKYQTSCYHLVTEMKTWQQAERHCKNYYNGHLLTIRDMLEDYFLEIAKEFNQKLWIGIKIKAQLQQKWTSGWYVSYERFNKDELYVEGTCIARKNRNEWITFPCTEELQFICEVSKASPPVLKLPPTGAHCPKELDDWRDLGGEYCYSIEITTTGVNFFEAQFHCARRGGDLVSLHSQEETDILQPFVRYKIESFYIGLVRLLAYNEEKFAWVDGSKLDYQNWSPDEPDKEEEKCTAVRTPRMGWHDYPCENKWLGYICSVKKIVPKSSLLHENADCKNFCIAPLSYLYGIISQCPDAKEMS